MNTETVFTAIRILVSLLLGGLALYYQANARLKEAVAGLIAEAEFLYMDTVKAGGMKHAYVTERLYRMLPVYVRPILTKEILSAMVDNTFAAVEDYAKKQLDKAARQILETAASHIEGRPEDTKPFAETQHSAGTLAPGDPLSHSQSDGTEGDGREQI